MAIASALRFIQSFDTGSSVVGRIIVIRKPVESTNPKGSLRVEQGLTSYQTHYRGRVFMGQMTEPTVSKIDPKD